MEQHVAGIAYDEHAALRRRELDLRESVATEVAARGVGRLPDLEREPREQLARGRVVRRAGLHRTAVIGDHCGFDLHGDLLEVGERFMPVH